MFNEIYCCEDIAKFFDNFSEYKPEYDKLRKRKEKELSKKEKKDSTSLPDTVGKLGLDFILASSFFFI